MRTAGRTLSVPNGIRTISLLIYFAAVLLFLFVSIRTWVYVYDEGFALLNGERVLRGEIPYRDFWTVYPPGQSYALAAVWGLFGSTLAVARTYDTLVRFMLVVGVYLVGRRIANTSIALLAAALVALWLGTIMFYAYAIFPALALALFALVCLIEYAATGRLRWLAIGGVLTGATALFRADIAVYLGISVVLAWVSSSLHSSSQRSTALRAGAAFLGCAAAVAVPFYLYLFFAGGAEQVWQALVVFPLTTFRDVRRLPYPQLMPNFALFFQNPRQYVYWAQFYLPLLIAAVSALITGSTLLKIRNAADHKLTGGIAVTVLGGLVFAQALSRYDWIHALPAAIGAVL
ncbi:MAG: glycosyltransferase family 39 protein, partial [Anaerolineae bacterium]|nr:glycosyltransferase family 39 protein [Anaerolineae bacterium]